MLTELKKRARGKQRLDDNSFDAVLITLDGLRMAVGLRRLPQILQRLPQLRPGKDPVQLLKQGVGQILAKKSREGDERVGKDEDLPWSVRLAAGLRQAQRNTLKAVLKRLESLESKQGTGS